METWRGQARGYPCADPQAQWLRSDFTVQSGRAAVGRTGGAAEGQGTLLSVPCVPFSSHDKHCRAGPLIPWLINHDTEACLS